MSDNAREQIFSRLRSAVRQGPFTVPKPEPLVSDSLTLQEKIEMLRQKMEAMRTEVHVTAPDNWTDTLKAVLRERHLSTLLYAPDTPVGKAVAETRKSDKEGLPELIPYDREVETFREELFHNIDAAITSARGGIAETGALILWPDEKEPRLMSLVPPVHIAVLEADKIYNDFAEAVERGAWATQMPTNALMISGPSKTADIELVLAFGVHGPKELIVIILEK